MEVNQRIFHLLQLRGKTASELSKYIGISNASVSAWKNDGSYPSSKYIEKISDFLNTTPDFLILGKDNLPPTLRGDEKRLLRIYDELDDNGRRMAMLNMYRLRQKRKEDAEWWETHQDAVTRLMEESFGPDWGKTPKNDVAPQRWDDDDFDDFERDDTRFSVDRDVPYFDIRASAGTGAFLDTSDYTILTLPFDKVPISASFCVGVNGDSMMPEFEDEDVLFVKQQPTVEDGELGIFILNGDAYFKKYVRNGKQPYLHSLNTDYDPIKIKAHDEIRTVGKVLGKYDGRLDM